MAKHIEDDVAYYYDFHPTEEDLMGETSVHAALVHYLMEVLTWLFRGQTCAIYENLNFYQTVNPAEYPLAPDIALLKQVDFQHLRSWKVSKTGLAPQVVFEIASEETWKKDLDEKPLRYAQMGVEEYFAYDPNEPPLRRRSVPRLYGWHLSPGTGKPQMQTVPGGPQGRLWSPHLDSFLVPDGELLRLYDRQGHLRLTQAEDEAEARRAETRRAEVLAEKLRSLGIDPDKL